MPFSEFEGSHQYTPTAYEAADLADLKWETIHFATEIVLYHYHRSKKKITATRGGFALLLGFSRRRGVTLKLRSGLGGRLCCSRSGRC